MEKIQSHAIKDIWRVREGLLLEVHKFKTLGHCWIRSKKSVKQIRGCKGLTELKEDYCDSYTKKTYPKGTLIYNTVPVEPEMNKNNFKFEIKSSGGSIFGKNSEEIKEILDDIEKAINAY
ncbi:hypothetical protein [Paenibacillus sp. 1781tsa1]|uniref:hypothetical protein n=1 Tax=Paenibacillus sp. 1781tsa1 TaxID=2953810 RepID=UPI00209E15BC|nr:hypothetical protein [Paenibacillus sp. 1781tsa1]MCP1185017.1 hypothetical protein [Paenibacillus sp. 1781tsa1]